jgi:prepilin-type N-terminal cleavage/methylation domain-containing protein
VKVVRRRSDKGFTLIELLIVVAIIGIIAAIAVTGLLRARMSGNEASAIGSIRGINSGQSAYSSACAHGGYATTLKDLVKPPTGSTAGFISPDLDVNGVLKSGYVVSIGAGTVATPVTLAANTCNVSSADSVASYFGEAHPVTPGSTGGRAFGTDQRGTIFQDPTGGGSVPFTAATVWTATTPLQ